MDYLDKMQEQKQAAEDRGKRLARNLLSDPHRRDGRVFDPTYDARVLAHLLDILAQHKGDHESTALLHEWTWEHYWGLQVAKHLPLFDELFQQLHSLGATRRHPLVWGDIDCSGWIEPHETTQIVVVEVHCAGREDNTYVFLRQGIHFHGRTVWPREVKWRYGVRNWPNDRNWRDIAKPSLGTYRRHHWQLGYGDFRDEGYAFSYDAWSGKVEGALAYHGQITAALRELRGIAEGIEHPYRLPKDR